MSSSAAAPAVRSEAIAAHAACIVRNSSSSVDFTGRSGTVASTASAINASVPSAPISKWLKMAAGVSKSRKAFSE